MVVFFFKWNFIQDISRCEDSLATLKAMQGQTPSPELELDIARFEKEIELYSQEKLCYEAQILRVPHLCLCVFKVISKCQRCLQNTGNSDRP